MAHKSGNIVPLAAIIIAALSLSLAGYFYWQNRQPLNQAPFTTLLNNNPTNNKPSGIQCEPFDSPPTSNWKVYTGETSYTQDGSTIFCVKYPAEWLLKGKTLYPYGENADKGLESTIVLGAGGHGAPEAQEIKKFSGGEAKYYLTSKKINGVDYLSGYATFQFANKPSYIFEVNHLLPKDQQIFDQILSTFKIAGGITNAPETPTTTAKKLAYQLPSGWLTAQNPSKTYEVSYDPEKYVFNDRAAGTGINILPKNGGAYAYFLNILPYDGGSRHQFILQGTTDYQSSWYHEQNYTYNGMSCLVLYGVDVSQWPPTVGMCAINGSSAFYFSLRPSDDATAEKIVSTIRLLK